MDLPAFPFSSCLGTPILFLTVHVRSGLPVLVEGETTAILRDTWLRSAARDRWLVGPYRVLPDQVRLLACSGEASRSLSEWTGEWKASAAVRIKAVIGGRGPLWEIGVTPELVVSAADYETRCAALLAEHAGSDHDCAFFPARQGGMLWQLLPAAVPDPAPAII